MTPPFGRLRAPQKRGPCQCRPRAPQNSFCFGNPAVPEGPVAFRPTIARGLALSIFTCKLFLILDMSKCRTIREICSNLSAMACYINRLAMSSQSDIKPSKGRAYMPIWDAPYQNLYLIKGLTKQCPFGRGRFSMDEEKVSVSRITSQ